MSGRELGSDMARTHYCLYDAMRQDERVDFHCHVLRGRISAAGDEAVFEEEFLPTTAVVHDPEFMRATLERHLRSREGTPLRVHACRVENARRRDGSRGTIQYELQLEDPATGYLWDQIVTGVTYGGDRTRHAWESINRNSGLATGPPSQSNLASFAYDPELDFLIQVFPHDYRLPALAILMAGPPTEFLPPLMADLGPGDWHLDRWNADLVQYRVDMRAILRLTIGAIDSTTGRGSQREFYAKIYRDTEHGRRAHHAQADLHTCAAADGEHLVIAKPVLYEDELRTLVTEAVPGMSLSKIVRRDKSTVAAVQAAARAIAEFHALNVVAPPRPIAGEIAGLQQAQEFLASVRPDLADSVSEMIETVISGLESSPAALIHGDLKPDHILIDGDRVALIDFDHFAAADPIIDIAHLLAFLGKPQERSRSRRDQTADVSQVFVDEYFDHAAEAGRARLPLYHAMTSIHKAVGLSRRRGSDRQHLVLAEDVLREGQALLESGGNGSAPSYKRRLTRSSMR
jgi:tRNA A-37 threonylcarbamoyl transferase component Bud32